MVAQWIVCGIQTSEFSPENLEALGFSSCTAFGLDDLTDIIESLFVIKLAKLKF